MTALDLRKEVAKNPLILPELGALPESELLAARHNWRQRMVSEHASARVFSALVGQAMHAGLARRQVYELTRMAREELDHGLLCARALVALGGDAVADLPALDPIPAHEDADPLEALLRNVLSVSCASETVAVALVATEREQAGPPAIRQVLDQILKDEVGHARFGWRLLAERPLTPALRDRLSEYLVDVFAHQLAFHSPFLSMPCSSAEGIALGAPHGRSNWLVFVETMRGVVIPGLERHGLRATEAWQTVTGEAAIAA